ncbi:FecR family protein [Chitinophaga cymbidii]|uniref:Anti-sigma factor n=1 Tax=Chitinophaga cymbidii TaxID=1096750 RepID=A0A512REQ3_9BACT|nr:FecR domain-containing protein [Chitinophaga cymbidii]GEP94179.1 hypothetical protein CCY01nite_04390 [Chitinophaga cymbidii]
MEWKDYSDYGPEDFLTDDYFSEWVLQPTKENEAFWAQWQQLDPARKPFVEEARRILLSLEYVRDEMPVESYDRIWSVLSDEMTQSAEMAAASRRKRPATAPRRTWPYLPAVASRRKWPAAAPRRTWPYLLAAAAVTGLLVLAAAWFFRKEARFFQEEAPPVTYTSQFGENRSLILPDSSRVVLAPHSTLRTGTFEDKREVWLEGEAFFDIRQQPGTAKPFTVHSRSLDIDVLGTTFNVNNYNGNTQVVLHTGKVALRRGKKVVVMKPGELVEFRAEEEQYQLKEVRPEPYTSWVKGTLTFEDTPLETVAQRLFYQYGVHIVFRDTSLAKEKFSATLPDANLQVVITALKEAFSLNVKAEKDNTYIFYRQ